MADLVELDIEESTKNSIKYRLFTPEYNTIKPKETSYLTQIVLDTQLSLFNVSVTLGSQVHHCTIEHFEGKDPRIFDLPYIPVEPQKQYDVIVSPPVPGARVFLRYENKNNITSNITHDMQWTQINHKEISKTHRIHYNPQYPANQVYLVLSSKDSFTFNTATLIMKCANYNLNYAWVSKITIGNSMFTSCNGVKYVRIDISMMRDRNTTKFYVTFDDGTFLDGFNQPIDQSLLNQSGNEKCIDVKMYSISSSENVAGPADVRPIMTIPNALEFMNAVAKIAEIPQ